ncbi:D-alanyl-D-alanine carboxypeptidase/D-alanyl-D-alanine-endopeptidase [Pendulispora albinea]|uniref:D-alanyl-D-alanine carboxypeptidase/D-alanyl-D-alanine-endopeptidase n=1 Tax=Pendulispora albinea TaxID=2741071 RepID=A0ABZ2LLD8_9BACT
MRPSSGRAALGLLAALTFAGDLACSTPGADYPDSPTPVPAAEGVLEATSRSTLDATIQAILQRPVFQGAHWGMKFQLLGANEPMYAMNPAELFLVGSAFKVFVAGTALATLGEDYRFRTRVYRTGPVVKGILRGNLVLVAGGDLLLGGRLQPDGSLAFPDPDHSYGMAEGAAPAPGDPLRVIREIAAQVAAQGIRRIGGRVLVDASMFREGKADIAQGGISVPVSPMMINDNIIDVTVAPGQHLGAPGLLRTSPQTAYLHIVNEVTTIAPGGSIPRPLRFTNDVANPDGTHTVHLTGDILLGGKSSFQPYYVPGPVRFAEMAFAEALRDEGVRVHADPSVPTDLGALASFASARHLVAEHVAPALADEMKGMLKVSSNIHTAYFPYLIGALAGHDEENPEAAYDVLRGRLFEKAGLEPNPPGARDLRYTPDFFVTFLSYLARQPYLPTFRQALPILGRDGSLTNVQVSSPVAGHVYAKTGTAALHVASNPMAAKALAGYIQLPDGRAIAFAEFVRIPVSSLEAAISVSKVAGEALGEIATAVYLEASRN